MSSFLLEKDVIKNNTTYFIVVFLTQPIIRPVPVGSPINTYPVNNPSYSNSSNSNVSNNSSVSSNSNVSSNSSVSSSSNVSSTNSNTNYINSNLYNPVSAYPVNTYPIITSSTKDPSAMSSMILIVHWITIIIVKIISMNIID